MVGGNPPNHLGDFEKRLTLKPCFLLVNVGLECGMWKRGSRKMEEEEQSLETWRVRQGKEKDVCILCVIVMEDG